MHGVVSKFERSNKYLQTCTKYANANISQHNGMDLIRIDIAMFYDVFIQYTCLTDVIRTPHV
jgi:hypothetical protein